MSVTVEFTDDEFAALYAALDPEGHYWRGVERLDWTAYAAAKARIAAVGRAREPRDPDVILDTPWVRVDASTWTKE